MPPRIRPLLTCSSPLPRTPVSWGWPRICSTWHGKGDCDDMGALRGVILDMDGLLIDSELWSWQAHNEALAAYDLPPLSLEEVRRLVGLDGDDEWVTLREIRALPDVRSAYYRASRAAFVALRSRSLAPMPGVHDLL